MTIVTMSKRSCFAVIAAYNHLLKKHTFINISIIDLLYSYSL